MFVQELLTLAALLDLLRSNPKNRKRLHHNFHDDIHHLGCRRHLSVNFKALKEIFYALEDVDESVVARANVHSCLKGVFH
jgi:hypothetical protein